MESDEKYDVYLDYAGGDRSAIMFLAQKLQERDLRVFPISATLLASTSPDAPLRSARTCWLQHQHPIGTARCSYRRRRSSLGP